MSREIKVGLLILAALAVLAVGVFTIGERGNLFRRDNRYFVHFASVNGLAEGSPVQLNGVAVGKVEQVVLPQKIDEPLLTVWVSVDRRYENRVRTDSTAWIKTVGLLGDKYIELVSGTAEAEMIPSGGQIPAAPTTDVDRLLATGEDVAENVAAISVSLRNILGRMEAGEGILGELTTDSDAGRRAKNALVSTLESLDSISRKIEGGDGTLATLINDDALGSRLTGAIGRLETLLASAESGDGAFATLLHDSEVARRITTTLDDLGGAAASLREFATELEEGDGLLTRLVSDEEYGRRMSEEIERLIESLSGLATKLESGDGTLGQLVNDPEVYQAIDDILVGVNESRLLRWLIRNRQKKGIRVRYETAQEEAKKEESPRP